MDFLGNLPVIALFLSGLAIFAVALVASVRLHKPTILIAGGATFAALCVMTAFVSAEQSHRGDLALDAAISAKYDVDVPLDDTEDGWTPNRPSKETVWVIDGEARACTLDADVNIGPHPTVDYLALVCDGTELPTG